MCLYTCSLEVQDQTNRSELRTFHEEVFDEYYCNNTCYETNEFLCPHPSLRYNILQQLLSIIWSLQVDYKPITINNTYHHIMSSSIIISYHKYTLYQICHHLSSIIISNHVSCHHIRGCRMTWIICYPPHDLEKPQLNTCTSHVNPISNPLNPM